LKNKTTPNTDGLINCLLQPGLIRNQPLKSMRVNFQQLIKFCGTRTVPATETMSIGLQADARVVMVFALLLIQFKCNMTNPAHLSGPRHLDNFILTINLHPSTRTMQKHMPTPTLTPTHYCSTLLTIRRAVSCKFARKASLYHDFRCNCKYQATNIFNHLLDKFITTIDPLPVCYDYTPLTS
jgi:hypothetical protein